MLDCQCWKIGGCTEEKLCDQIKEKRPKESVFAQFGTSIKPVIFVHGFDSIDNSKKFLRKVEQLFDCQPGVASPW